MRKGKGLWALVAGLGVLGAFLIFNAVAPVTAQETKEKPTLQETDCVKCHANPPADLTSAGGKHKFVGCLGCHTGHRPASKNNIPECSQCHGGKPHFELKNCMGCHKNPHTPKNIILPPNTTKPCLTCHTEQNKQLQANKSKHTMQACSFCHDVHGKKPECTQCHKSHSDEITANDCRVCHKAHMPKVVTYPSNVPNKACAACHKKAYDLLTTSKTKHQTKSCAFCHNEVHKTVPLCSNCHGTPHPEGILSKFGSCGDCHGIAHDLNNFKKPTAPKRRR